MRGTLRNPPRRPDGGRWSRRVGAAACSVVAALSLLGLSGVPAAAADLADLRVQVTDAVDPVAAGARITYTVSVHDFGPAASANIVVEDDVDISVTDLRFEDRGPFTCTASGSISCDLASLAAGADAAFTFSVRAPSTGPSVQNFVSVHADTADPNPNNDQDDETTTVVSSPPPSASPTPTAAPTESPTPAPTASPSPSPPPARHPQIHLAASAMPPRVPVGGGEVSFTYVVTNTGNVPLSGISGPHDRACAAVRYRRGDNDGDSILDRGERWVYACSVRLSAATTSISTVVGHAGARLVSDATTVSVGGPAAPSPGVTPPFTGSGSPSASPSSHGPNVTPPETSSAPPPASPSPRDSSVGWLLIVLVGSSAIVGAAVPGRTRHRR